MDNRDVHIRIGSQSCRMLDVENKDSHELVVPPNSVSVEGKEAIHVNVAHEKIPKLGMEFETEEEAYDFYNNYAREVGFSIRRSKGHKDATGKWIDRIFCCSYQGIREKDKRDDDVKYHRLETRCGCLAEMKLNSRFTGKYRVIKFVPEHTHILASPRMLLRSQRTINSAKAAKVELADSSGIAPKAGIGLMARKVGGLENVGNYLHSKRTEEMRIGDTGGLLEYLQNMQSEDPNFSYAIQVDLDDLITNVFWTDGRMKLDYEYFGDVVCFDTTYKKNKEGWPFALFVGVNHHKQNIIFGAAMLYDETSETFIWLFDSFVKAMSGKKPQTILTDQDAAMAKALASQWPETHHRLCVWHMYQNATKHLSDMFGSFSNFANDFSNCVYDHDDEEDFVDAWNEMLIKYDLKNNSWLKKQFELREKWALVYGRQIFCADMYTTQRSESMNNQIKNYIVSNCDMLRFFHHFQRLVDDRRHEELKVDFKSTQSRPSLACSVEILKHAGDVYTLAIFELFNRELWLTWDCEMHTFEVVGTVTKFKVIPPGKPRHHIVSYDSLASTVMCSCKKFEFVGILCAHALKVLSFKNFKRVPDQYILKRWTKDAKCGSAIDASLHAAQHNNTTNVGTRYKVLLRLYSHLAARAAVTDESFNIALDAHATTLNNIETSLKNLSIEECTIGGSCFEAHASQGDDSVQLDNQENKIKGLKQKGRDVSGCTSCQRKGALERATKKRKCQNEALPHTQLITQPPNLNALGSRADGCNQLEQFPLMQGNTASTPN